MYHVKSVNFHFENPAHNFEVNGSEAQRIWFYLQYEENPSFIEIHLNQQKRLIPISSIMYIDFHENEEANDIQKRLHQNWGLIQFLTDIYRPHENEWYIQGTMAFIGDEQVSNNPKVVELLREIEWLDEQLIEACSETDVLQVNG
jgi:hypothetical protein